MTHRINFAARHEILAMLQKLRRFVSMEYGHGNRALDGYRYCNSLFDAAFGNGLDVLRPPLGLDQAGTLTSTVRFVQKVVPVASGSFRVLVDRYDDRLDVLIAPPFPRR